MDFKFSEEEEAFRQEIREFVQRELPSGWIAGMLEDEYNEEVWPLTQQIVRKLAAKGWLTLAWPKEYGGQGRSIIENLIYQEETSYWGVPGTDMGIGGISWVGPSLMLFGSEQQKKEHLPKIAAGERFWCTGYSEPDAGSDLAALQCRAVASGDDYIINGQKLWTSAAHIAGWCWLAARTNPDVPKHKGISLFLVDMKDKNITIRHLTDLSGAGLLNEVFFDGVRVPKANRVGEENQGWYYVLVALNFERGGPGVRFIAGSRRVLDELVAYSRQTRRNGQPLASDAFIRYKLAEMAIEIEAGRLIAYHAAWMQTKGLIPESQASMAKVYGSELFGRVINGGTQILGLYGQLGRDLKWAPLKGWIERTYLFSPTMTILSGTSEIMRNIIAIRGLGLPPR